MTNQEKFNRNIQELENVLDKKGNHLAMASVFVSIGNESYSHFFMEPQKVDIRSIAKPIVCMAFGIAIEKGLFFDGVKINLDTPIWQFLSKFTSVSSSENIRQWQKITLIDCFRITIGHDKGLMFSADIKEQDENNLANYVVNYPITGEVGKDFVYSNAGTFLISTIITEFMGIGLDDFVNQALFTPLSISDFSWKKFGKYCAGCTGLKMKNEDLHKIGTLLLNDGVYEGKQLVPINWINKMKTPQVVSPTHRYIADRTFPKWSYGMNLWICEDGNYYCDGSEGQYLIIIPKNKTIITSLGYQTDTEPISSSFGIWK